MIYLFLAAAVFQLLAWRWIYPAAFSTPDLPGADHHLPVSVVVCFRNEAGGLERCLSGILAQRHPDFEVIAVDDHSTDGSATIVRRLQLSHPNLRLVRPGPTRPGKKDALRAGIDAARHDAFLLTDADCAPASPHWISRMTAPLPLGFELVLGCSPYLPAPGLLNRWQRFEATHTALQYLGFARREMPYMGVGRNLAYTRTFFSRNGGLQAHGDLPGGDDDLLVNANARPDRAVCVTDPAAWTYSAPTLRWSDYLRQKLRHQSAGPRYRLVHTVVLTVLALSHGLFFLLGFLLLFSPFWSVAVAAYVFRSIRVHDCLSHPGVRQFMGGGAGARGIGLLDAALAPFYLFLSVATVLPAGRW